MAPLDIFMWESRVSIAVAQKNITLTVEVQCISVWELSVMGDYKISIILLIPPPPPINTYIFPATNHDIGEIS